MTQTETSADFIRGIVADDNRSGKFDGRVITRFPPEPNGYLHIGHAKSVCLNFGLAAEFGGVCHLRFDDTNPTREEVEYVKSIQEDVRWLGWDWGVVELAAAGVVAAFAPPPGDSPPHAMSPVIPNATSIATRRWGLLSANDRLMTVPFFRGLGRLYCLRARTRGI